MSMSDICPCVNATCPNHGKCDRCISRHTRLGSLNYCSYYTILPLLEKAIAADPSSPAAAPLKEMVDHRCKVYGEMMAKHGLTEEKQAGLRKKVAEYSDY